MEVLTIMRGMVTVTRRYQGGGHEAVIGGGHVMLRVAGGGGAGHRGGHRVGVSRADQGHGAGHGGRGRGRVHARGVVAGGRRHLGAPAGPGRPVLTHQRHEVGEVVLARPAAVLLPVLGSSTGAGVVVRVGVIQVLGRQTCNIKCNQ